MKKIQADRKNEHTKGNIRHYIFQNFPYICGIYFPIGDYNLFSPPRL